MDYTFNKDTIVKRLMDSNKNLSEDKAIKQAETFLERYGFIEKKLQNGSQIFEMILPTAAQPKFSKEYAAFIEGTPLLKRTCGDCMHFIADTNRCQIVGEEGNEEIHAEDGCRIQRDNYELEGFRPPENTNRDTEVENESPTIEIISEKLIYVDDHDNNKGDL